jgi:hypothetical protein
MIPIHNLPLQEAINHCRVQSMAAFQTYSCLPLGCLLQKIWMTKCTHYMLTAGPVHHETCGTATFVFSENAATAPVSTFTLCGERWLSHDFSDHFPTCTLTYHSQASTDIWIRYPCVLPISGRFLCILGAAAEKAIQSSLTLPVVEVLMLI